MFPRPQPSALTLRTAPRSPRSRHDVLLLVVAMAALVAGAGCAGSGGRGAGSPSPADGVVQVVGTDDLRFDPASLEVAVGTEVELVCEPAVNHNLVVVETGREIAVCSPGGTDRGVVDLEPGEYTYLCTVPGHSATMRGALTVTERVEAR